MATESHVDRMRAQRAREYEARERAAKVAKKEPAGLSGAESERLVELEAVVDRGRRTFVEVGQALSEIRERRLYRATHREFDDYCRARWGMSESSAVRQIAAAGVVSNLKTLPMATVPANEAQARPLAHLAPIDQQEAWQRALDQAAEEQKRVTAAHVKRAVKREPASTVEPCAACGCRRAACRKAVAP